MKYAAISIRGNYLSLYAGASADTGAVIDAALGLLRADGTGIEDGLDRSAVDAIREQAGQSRFDNATQRVDLPEPPDVSDTIRDRPPLFPYLQPRGPGRL